jgi:hypothetical protein
LLNRFNTAIAEGTYRGLLTSLATLAFVTLTTYVATPALDSVTGIVVAEDQRWKAAIIAGLIAMIAPFASQAVQGASDQRRAQAGKVKPADVPVQIESYRREAMMRAAGPAGVSQSRVARYVDEDLDSLAS